MMKSFLIIWLFVLLLTNLAHGLLKPDSSTSLLTQSISNLRVLSRSIVYRKNALLATKSDLSADEIKRNLFRIFDSDEELPGNIYACPESLQPLSLHSRYYGIYAERLLVDKKFGAKYAIRPNYIDLVTPVGNCDKSSNRLGQWAFQNPILSKIYERGYRQNFEWFGFPGIDAEYMEAEQFFTRANATHTLLDMSCGSGFMTRRFIKSNKFFRVIGADLSPTMLKETLQNCITERIQPPELVRCDSAKLPFIPDSISSVHAGAAMHCWPEIQQSLLEVHRVLKPGGAFFATTFTQQRAIGRQQIRNQGFSLFSSAEEIEQLVKDAGFVQTQVRREGDRCVVVKALKAPADANFFDTA